MDRAGLWRLAPAYDMTYACNPAGQWTSQHQMSIHGKRDGIGREDLVSLASVAGIKPHRAVGMIERVRAAFIHWPDWAAEAEVPEDQIRQVGNMLEMGI
jgi:serine/threonine-protein kinase HipA